MQIIIPMAGVGNRFLAAGYQMPKPLIEVEGKPIISHVIEMFPGEKRFLFICNQEHLSNPSWNMETILLKYCPDARIMGIAPHKQGPVHTVLQAGILIEENDSAIVNYCDFTCYWNWTRFKTFVLNKKYAGMIPAYKGFHPHSLGSTHYAYMRESQGLVMDIQEKRPYTGNPMEEFASSGTYYFASGHLMLEAFGEAVDQDWSVGGEYYVSLAYKHLLAKRLPVGIWPLQHFMQWGTPEDLAEYKSWSSAFQTLTAPVPSRTRMEGATVVAMAGEGRRFSDEEYGMIKPLIPVSGRPMGIQSILNLPDTTKYVFVLRKDLPGHDTLIHELEKSFPKASVVLLSDKTEGQACTAMLGLTSLEDQTHGFVTFASCDHGILYDAKAFNRLMDSSEIDVVVWASRHHAKALQSPHMFGWIREEQGVISEISVKKPLNFPETDPIVIGIFSFCKRSDAYHSLKRLMKRNGRVNGEFYMDSCINDALALGYRCHMFEVDAFFSWGTPDDLKTFQYWQSCFHKWKLHPYRLELDSWIPKEMLPHLEKSYCTFSEKL